jgi:5-methylcytosine-specific restriction protein A
MASAWQGSTRRQTLGKEYFRNRALVMKRDGKRCQIRTPGLCIGTATDCDHIGNRLDHRPENMRAACSPCHLNRSGQQGGQAAGTNRRARAASRLRAPEQHPGVVPPAPGR